MTAKPNGHAATRAVELSMFPDLRAHKAVGPLVPSVITGTNADLIEQVRKLGYLDGDVIDLTYGDKGGWWKRWRPDQLTVFEGDFTQPIDGQWDTVCYDPPYIDTGGTETSTVPGFQSTYGINTSRRTSDVLHLVTEGLENAAHATRDYLLVKCMDYVSGGRFRPMTHWITGHALGIGLFMHDEIIHHAGSGPGGHNIVTQKRARRTHSKLLVFTWDRR